MPKGPQGQKRPADVIGNAMYIARIATGEIEATTLKQPAERNRSLVSAMAYEENTIPEDRKAIDEKAAEARWG